METLKEQTRALARELNVVGLMNIQFAVRTNDITCSRSIRARRAPCPL
jgi:hypothetical protein